MEENTNKSLDRISKKIIKEASLESPSFDFTETVMSQIKIESSKNAYTEYNPLISKTLWIYIVAIFLVLFFLANIGIKDAHNSFSFIDLIKKHEVLRAVSNYKLSKHISYAVILFCLMICIQIPFLKNYFDKRINV